MKTRGIPFLTREGLFLVAGKVCYAQALLDARFDGEEHPPVGVEAALDELEDAREVLLRFIVGPPDRRAEFIEYCTRTHEITLNLDSVLPCQDINIEIGPQLTLVSSESPEPPLS
jgi:hypothetical protein